MTSREFVAECDVTKGSGPRRVMLTLEVLEARETGGQCGEEREFLVVE